MGKMGNGIYQITLVNEATGKQTQLKVQADKYILDAAEEQGIDLPYACRTGACVTCAGRVLQGSVEHDHNFLRSHELRAGFVLICKTFPKSDCTIATHQEDEFLNL